MKTILLIITILASGFIKADYQIKININDQINFYNPTWTLESENISSWISSGSSYNCNWFPALPTTEPFNVVQNYQCSQNEFRTIDRTLKNIVTNELKAEPTLTENRTVLIDQNTREYRVEISNVLSSNEVCSTWTPNTNTIEHGVQFQQTSNNCSITEIRNRKEYYIENENDILKADSNIQNIIENQTRTRNSTGNSLATFCFFSVNTTPPVTEPYSVWAEYLDANSIPISQYVAYKNNAIYSAGLNSYVVSGGYAYTRGTYVTTYSYINGLGGTSYYNAYRSCKTPII